MATYGNPFGTNPKLNLSGITPGPMSYNTPVTPAMTPAVSSTPVKTTPVTNPVATTPTIYKSTGVNAGIDPYTLKPYASTTNPVVPTAPTAPIGAPSGSQFDAKGDIIYPLNVNPLNSNGAVPSSSLGTSSFNSVLSNRNLMENLQNQLIKAYTQSPEELQAQKDLTDVGQKQLELNASQNAEIDRLMTSGNLTREQASGFVTETARRANQQATNLAIQKSAYANVLSPYQTQRENQLKALEMQYNMNKPTSVGGNLINPVTGEIVYQSPGEAFNLSPGQIRYDAQGNVIAQGGAESSGLTPYQQFQATQAIANQTQKFTDASRELQRQSSILTDTWNRYATGEAKDLNATTQAIVTTFNKLLDPTSVVREAEYDRSAGGQALLSTISGKLAAVVQGGPGLTPASLKELVDLGNLYAQNANQSVQQANARATQLAQQFGLNPSFVTTPGYSPTQTGLTGAPIIKTKVGDIDPNW